MEKETIIDFVRPIVESEIDKNPSHFLVEVKVKPTNNIKIYIDGDTGVGIDDLVQYNKAVYGRIEEANFFPEGDFSLEISSPGLSEPLKLMRQYYKNIGRYVEVVKKDDVVLEGKLIEVAADKILLEIVTGKGKKAITTNVEVILEDIKTIKIQIKF